MDDDLALAQDLCARICHDLGGPLGSVTAALDLLGQEPEATEVARDGARISTRRLHLWRVVAGAGGGPLGRQGIAELLDGALPGGRTQPDVSGLPPEDLPAETARAVLAAVMLGAEALPRGGVVHVAGTANGLAVWPEGRNASWPHALTATLAGEAVSGPREVLSPLLLRLAARAGLRMSLLLGQSAGCAPLMLQRG
ncbi:histidine phosphotransferase family protein [Roseomonas sp. BN140053]|uniref:histidine phosphotransferase family protein n=1 Tax=Roseomonas sp. BN140053 TaxID=3391898 RepID=UPI0039E74FE9